MSSFGLFVGLLRQREIPERLFLSEFFARIKSYVNGVCVPSRIGAKSNVEQTIQNLNSKCFVWHLLNFVISDKRSCRLGINSFYLFSSQVQFRYL